MICDKKYAEKSDQRSGGAGTEAQIISASLYTKTDQNKFVAVVRERNADGHAYLPTYYKGRIYIDLIDEARYGEEFDRLLRWIYDRPLYAKPEMGKPPAFLNLDSPVKLTTAVPLRRAVDAIKAGRDQAEAFSEQYLDVIISELNQFVLEGGGENFDEKILKSIDDFIPYRNELVEFFINVATYRPTEAMAKVIHRFFEKLIVFNYPRDNRGYNNWSFDNFKFISNEIFCITLAL
ncbi:hypothetical protein FV222_03885 [Methylobacterium sp. WL103]|uniref:hypothetical protein n=1 Tax=Methylobacterium sp. WL103 TaxID=2603891 RepID=UPI0011CC8B73|nr:hypothetical protein [Methylobacterium sp. WL103]TXN06950.1 hypothetical protein FV222_03885 [Methylobacterium sp. WL103]